MRGKEGGRGGGARGVGKIGEKELSGMRERREVREMGRKWEGEIGWKGER